MKALVFLMLFFPLLANASYKMGLVPTSDVIRTTKIATDDTVLPRTYSLKQWAPPVRDQGQCGSCVAFATTGVYETQHNIDTNFQIHDIDQSEQYLFSCGGGKCNYGWAFEPAVKYLRDFGQVDESCMPYLQKDVLCSTACADASTRIKKITAYHEVAFADFPKAIASGKVVLTGIAVYADYMTYKGGVYKTNGKILKGYHAQVVLGFNLDERWLLVRNSWGASYGENGYIRISMDDDKTLIMDGYIVDTF